MGNSREPVQRRRRKTDDALEGYECDRSTSEVHARLQRASANGADDDVCAVCRARSESKDWIQNCYSVRGEWLARAGRSLARAARRQALDYGGDDQCRARCPSRVSSVGLSEDRGLSARHRAGPAMACGQRGSRMDQEGRNGDQSPRPPTTVSASGTAAGGANRTSQSAMEHRLQGTLPNQGSTLLLSPDRGRLVQPLHHRLSGSECDYVRADLARVRTTLSRVRVTRCDAVRQRNAVLVQLGQKALEVVGSLDTPGY